MGNGLRKDVVAEALFWATGIRRISRSDKDNDEHAVRSSCVRERRKGHATGGLTPMCVVIPLLHIDPQPSETIRI